MNYVMERLKERSTWNGIMVFLTGVGVAISPEMKEAVMAAAVAVFGLVNVAWKDKK